MEGFTKEQAKLIINTYDILETLGSEEEMEMLEEQNPELAEALYALHRYAYGNPNAKIINEKKGEG